MLFLLSLNSFLNLLLINKINKYKISAIQIFIKLHISLIMHLKNYFKYPMSSSSIFFISSANSFILLKF